LIKSLITIVSSLPGPTPMALIGAPEIFSKYFTYSWAFLGRSNTDFAFEISSFQPGRYSYIGFA